MSLVIYCKGNTLRFGIEYKQIGNFQHVVITSCDI